MQSIDRGATGHPTRRIPTLKATNRQGWVLALVTEVLRNAGHPMQARAIHAAAEELAGDHVSWSSVKNCLVDAVRKQPPRFERVARGRYRITAD